MKIAAWFLAAVSGMAAAASRSLCSEDPATVPSSSAEVVRAAVVVEAREGVVSLDTPGDGSLWALGANYKARFGRDAVEFFPILGPRAPRNFPLRLEPPVAFSGDAPLDADSTAAPSVEGLRAVYDRGTFLEIYDLRPSELEQVFVFPQAMDLGAPLVLRVGLATDLRFVEETAEGFVFADPGGLGSVRYGRASTFDATGRAVETETRLSGGAIEIRLPAPSISGAVYPLTIDPIVAAFPIDPDGDDDFRPDVSYDATNAVWCVVYEKTISASDHDVVSRRFSDAIPPVPSPHLVVDATTEDWRRPRIANHNSGDGFLVVAERMEPGGSSWDVYGRIRDAATDTHLSPPFPIAATDSNETKPDVGGDATLGAGTVYLVAWEHQVAPGDRDVRGATVTHAAAPSVGAFLFLGASSLDDHDPAVSNSNGPGRVWGVVWTRDNSTTDRDILFRQVDGAGALGPGPTILDPTVADDDLADVGVRALGPLDPPRFIVVWQRAFAMDHDIIAIRLSTTPTANNLLSPPTNLIVLGAPTAIFQDQIRPTIDSDGCTWTCVYAEQASGTDYDVYSTNLYGAATIVVPAGEGHVPLVATGTRQDYPRIASRWSSSHAASLGGRGMTVWEDLVSPATGERDVGGAFHAAGFVAVAPTSCGAPAPGIAFSEAPALGGPFTVTVTAAQGGSLLLNAGLPGSLVLCGGTGACAVGVSIPALATLPVGGATFPIPCDPLLAGALLAFQGAEIGPPGGAGGCALGPLTVLLTDTLLVTVH